MSSYLLYTGGGKNVQATEQTPSATAFDVQTNRPQTRPIPDAKIASRTLPNAGKNSAPSVDTIFVQMSDTFFKTLTA